MSNVLIGIIGVILFIGLALAGALFLGPRFQDSTNNSKAAAIAQTLAQNVQALSLYEVQEGAAITTGRIGDLTTKGYIKPQTYAVFARNQNGTTDFGQKVDLVVISSRTRADLALDSVCSAYSRQTGASNGEIIDATAPPNQSAGCFRLSTQWANEPAGTLIYYQRT